MPLAFAVAAGRVRPAVVCLFIMDCAKCGNVVRVSDDPVVCVGKCNSRFHRVCTPLTKIAAKVVNDNENIVFKCASCLSAQEDGGKDDAMSSELTEIKSVLSSLSQSLTDTQSEIETQINSAIANGIDSILKSISNSLRESMASIEANVARKLDDFKINVIGKNDRDKHAAMSRKRSRTERMIHSESDSIPNKKKIISNKRDEPIEDVAKQNDEVFVSENALTYANVLAGSSGNANKLKRVENRKTRPVIVIKPVESSQSSEDTRIFLKNNLDPKIHKIRNFRNGKAGSIIAECATGDNIEVVKKDIESNLGEKYNAVIPTTAKPKLKIVGMSDQYSPEVVIDLLKSQNEDLGINEVKVIAQFVNSSFKYNKYNTIIEVDKDTFNHLMTAGKVNIGWDRCSIQEAVNVLRCFKCGEFGHKSTECVNPETCSKCSGLHKTSECSSTDFNCVNCLKSKKEFHLNLDVKHPAFSTQCPVYRRLFEKRKSNMLLSK